MICFRMDVIGIVGFFFGFAYVRFLMGGLCMQLASDVDTKHDTSRSTRVVHSRHQKHTSEFRLCSADHQTTWSVCGADCNVWRCSLH
jgi:hypothetical protein